MERLMVCCKRPPKKHSLGLCCSSSLYLQVERSKEQLTTRVNTWVVCSWSNAETYRRHRWVGWRCSRLGRLNIRGFQQYPRPIICRSTAIMRINSLERWRKLPRSIYVQISRPSFPQSSFHVVALRGSRSGILEPVFVRSPRCAGEDKVQPSFTVVMVEDCDLVRDLRVPRPRICECQRSLRNVWVQTGYLHLSTSYLAW